MRIIEDYKTCRGLGGKRRETLFDGIERDLHERRNVGRKHVDLTCVHVIVLFLYGRPGFVFVVEQLRKVRVDERSSAVVIVRMQMKHGCIQDRKQ